MSEFKSKPSFEKSVIMAAMGASGPGSNIAPLVDQLGRLKAEIAGLTKKETELKDVLKELGPGAYDGALFRATVSVAPRTTLDSKKIYATMDAAWIEAHTQTSDVETVKVGSLSAKASGESKDARHAGRRRAAELMKEIEGTG